MARYERGIVLRNVAQLHLGFDEMFVLARKVELNAARLGAGAPRAAATLAELQSIYAEFNRDLNKLAQETSVIATQKAKHWFDVTRKRPNTGVTPHLRTLIRSGPVRGLAGPLATGAVGVGNIDYLDKAIDPLYPGDGTYWRVQEYGYAGFVGKRVRGYFYGPGYSGPGTPPRSPPPTPLEPLFVPGATLTALGARGPRGGKGAGMLIRNPIEARLFLERGRNDAFAIWLSRLREIEAKVGRRLKAIAP